MPLSRPQKVTLEVEMRHLENALRNALQLMRAPENSLLTLYVPVSEATRRRLEPLIEEVLAKIEVVAREFQLEPQVEDVGRVIVAEMVSAEDGLYDTLSPKLRRYGDVDPALAETLDPHLRQLRALAREIGHIAVKRQ